jgi:hypothetical protein
MKNRIIGLVAALVFFSVTAWPQTGNAVVRGTVLDPSKASIAGAKITLTHQNTNILREATSSSVGIYYFGEVPPGPYSLTVENAGFKKWSGTFDVPAGQTVVIDPNLDVGDVASTVEVTAAASVISTEGMPLADVKDALRIHQLPLNGRGIATLFNLTPGVEGGGSPRVNGLKVGSTEMLFDGMSIVDRFGGGISRVSPGLDTVQEFRIETAGSDAQFSRPATVTLVTKSGTNNLHGSLFETHRNNSGGLRARKRQEGNEAEKLIRNEFGAAAGGPVFLPKIYNGRNRTFWFFAYEGLRSRTRNSDEDWVPTAEMWDGNFTNVIDNNGNRSHIYDPLTTDANGVRQPFAGDLVPKNRQSPFFDVMRSITHLPTNDTNPYRGPNLNVFYPEIFSVNTATAKGDHRFSDKDSISGRFTSSRSRDAIFGGVFGSPKEDLKDGFGTGRSEPKVYNTTINYTHLFSPGFLSQLLLANHRSAKSSGTLADSTNWAQRLGLPNPFGLTGWPTLDSGNDPWSWDGDNRKDENLTAYNIEEHLTLVKGKHSFKFGGKLRREYNNIRELQQAQGSHTFGEAWTGLYDPRGDQQVSFTGVGLASMALGIPTNLRNQYNRGYFYFRQWETGLYAHDSWKVTPRLTLELGVRWDKWTPYDEKYNRLVNLDLGNLANRFEVITPGNHRMEDLTGVPPSVLASWAKRGLTWRTAADAGLPDKLIPADNNNFGPRLGAAFRLTNKTSLRAGYGEYFWTMPLSQILQSSRTNPPLNLLFQSNFATLDGTDTYGVRTLPKPEYFIGKADVATTGIVPLPLTARSMMVWDVQNWRDGHARSWHFTLERELMKNTAMKLTYVGDHASDLEQRFSVNPRESQFNYQARTGLQAPSSDVLRVNPNWNPTGENKSGYSNTHSIQAEVERRYSSGLAFQWFYVFTRSLTTTDAGGFTSGGGDVNATGTSAGQVPDRVQILGEPGLSFDQRLRLIYYNSGNIPMHHIRWNGIYDLPFGRGKIFGQSASGILNHLIGGWQLATIGDWAGGKWMGVNSGRYLFGDPRLDPDQRFVLTFNGRPQRLFFRGDFDPRLASNVDQATLQKLIPVNQADRVLHRLGPNFDNRVLQQLANGSVRLTSITDNVNWNARNFFRGPRAWNVDASIFKNFAIREAVKVRFTADFFNAFNHPNDQNPNTTTGLQDLSQQPNEPRIIQLSLRLEW